jgi:hypothetical protein
MAKRHRTRPRQRRPAETAHRAAAAPRVDREAAPIARASAHRPVRARSTGYSRAMGTPSGALERAALVERNYISKDFRRLGLVVGVALALLVVLGFLEGIVLR